jgi:hypothetical protein
MASSEDLRWAWSWLFILFEDAACPNEAKKNARISRLRASF